MAPHVVTVIERPGSVVNAASKVAEVLASNSLWQGDHGRKVVEHVTEFQTKEAPTEKVKSALFELADELQADVVVQPSAHRIKRLVVFDMDSTLIQNECIDLIAVRAGVEAQVAEITERAMRGELDFAQSLAERVSLLKGIPTTVYGDLVSEISLTPGARELCEGLKARGAKLAVLSGGFQPIVDWIKEELKLDYAFANHLMPSQDGTTLAGTTSGPVVDGQRKAQLLEEIAAREGIALDDVAAVGDGSNDLPMMAKAGFGIAWHAKPLVQQKAPSRLNGPTLADALYIL